MLKWHAESSHVSPRDITLQFQRPCRELLCMRWLKKCQVWFEYILFAHPSLLHHNRWISKLELKTSAFPQNPSRSDNLV
jgi:hypothetical protein